MCEVCAKLKKENQKMKEELNLAGLLAECNYTTLKEKNELIYQLTRDNQVLQHQLTELHHTLDSIRSTITGFAANRTDPLDTTV